MSKIWMNGQLVDDDKAKVSIATHALHYGSGVFEGIRAYETSQGPAIFRLRDHLLRLVKSAEYYRMEIPYTTEELEKAIWQTILANNFKSCYIRPLVYRGHGQLGVNPLTCPVDVGILVWQWGAYLGDAALHNGIRATISPVVRFANEMMPTRAKATGQYLNSILAKLDADERGYEEAIMFNSQGFLAEGSGENIFVVKDNVVLTPRLEDDILAGITRDTIMDICGVLDIPVQECAISREMLLAADEVFATGTAAEVTPISSIDDAIIGSPGPVTKSVQEMFFRAVQGKEPALDKYLTFMPINE